MKGDGLHRISRSQFSYYKIKVNGRWHSVSTKTTSYHEAKRKRSHALKDREDGRLPEGEIARWPFERAASHYLQTEAALRLRASNLKKEAFLPGTPDETLWAPCLRADHRSPHPAVAGRDEKQWVEEHL